MINEFSQAYLRSLVDDAARSPRLRQHMNVHLTYEEPVQRLFNCISIDSYIRPHRHLLDPKFEFFLAVQGLFCLYTFSDQGEVLARVAFGTELYGSRLGVSVGVELAPGVWHTVIPLVSDAILLEIKAGPFVPGAAKEFADWAPPEQSDEGRFYLSKLQTDAESFLALSK